MNHGNLNINRNSQPTTRTMIDQAIEYQKSLLARELERETDEEKGTIAHSDPAKAALKASVERKIKRLMAERDRAKS